MRLTEEQQAAILEAGGSAISSKNQDKLSEQARDIVNSLFPTADQEVLLVVFAHLCATFAVGYSEGRARCEMGM